MLLLGGKLGVNEKTKEKVLLLNSNVMEEMDETQILGLHPRSSPGCKADSSVWRLEKCQTQKEPPAIKTETDTFLLVVRRVNKGNSGALLNLGNENDL